MENIYDDSCSELEIMFEYYLKNYSLGNGDLTADDKRLATEAWLALSSKQRKRHIKLLKADLERQETKPSEVNQSRQKQHICEANNLLGTKLPYFLRSLKLDRTELGVGNRTYYMYKYRQFLKAHIKALTTTFAGITAGIKLPMLGMKLFALPCRDTQPKPNPIVTKPALKASTAGDHQQQQNRSPSADDGVDDFFFLIGLHPFLRKMNGLQNQRFREKVISLIDNVLDNTSA